ncbi:cold shock domain-containing protein [bacterium]|nr:cold shock domain-containing protein [bacterium]
MQGTVKWFSKVKGIGFITSKNGEDIFVHFSKINRRAKSLNTGDAVEYTVGTNKNGAAAVSVEVLDV